MCFSDEPLKDSPYHGKPNVILTPHIAGSTNEAQDAVGVQIAHAGARVPTEGRDPERRQRALDHVEEYSRCCRTSAWPSGWERSWRNRARTAWKRSASPTAARSRSGRPTLIRNAAVAGVLNQMAHEKANLVNARSIAEERGIRVNEQKIASSGRGAAVNALTVSLNDAPAKAHGTGNGIARLVAAGSCGLTRSTLKLRLKGNIIYLRNRDVPGVIGRVGTVLGQHNVNIANFSLGPRGGGQEPRGAVAVVQVDSEISEAVLQDLRKIEAVEIAKAIRF